MLESKHRNEVGTHVAEVSFLFLLLAMPISSSLSLNGPNASNAWSPLMAPTITPHPPNIVRDSNSNLTSDPPSSWGGIPPYHCKWFEMGPTNGSSWTSLPSTNCEWTSTGSLDQIGTWSFVLQVTDSSTVPGPQTVNSEPVNVTVNWLAVTLTLSPSVKDFGQTTEVQANVDWSEATPSSPPYSVNLTTGGNGRCSAKLVTVQGENPQVNLEGNSASFTFSSPSSIGKTYYCAWVKDSSSAKHSAASLPFPFKISPQITISFHSTAYPTYSTTSFSFAGGTSPYTCVWTQSSGESLPLPQSFGCNANANIPTPIIPQSGTWYIGLQVTDAVGSVQTSLSYPVSGMLPTKLALTCGNTSSAVSHSSVVGLLVSCKATVELTSGTGPTPVGTINWSTNGTGKFSHTNCRLSAGACSTGFTPNATAPSVLLVANYTGNSLPSSGTWNLSVKPQTSKVVVFCSPSSLRVRSSKTITCIATVTGYSPTGNVAWSSSPKDMVSLQAGTTCALIKKSPNTGSCLVKFTLTGISSGKATIQATYGGDPNNMGSSAIRTITVK